VTSSVLIGAPIEYPPTYDRIVDVKCSSYIYYIPIWSQNMIEFAIDDFEYASSR
jgi:hypothetical protein